MNTVERYRLLLPSIQIYNIKKRQIMNEKQEIKNNNLSIYRIQLLLAIDIYFKHWIGSSWTVSCASLPPGNISSLVSSSFLKQIPPQINKHEFTPWMIDNCIHSHHSMSIYPHKLSIIWTFFQLIDSIDQRIINLLIHHKMMLHLL